VVIAVPLDENTHHLVDADFSPDAGERPAGQRRARGRGDTGAAGGGSEGRLRLAST